MKLIDYEELRFLVKESRDKKVLITFHSMGDTDAVASAIALSTYFTQSKVVMPDSISANSARTLRKAGVSVADIGTEFDDDADMVVLLDVNNFEDCGPFRFRLEEFNGTIIIMDHHAPKPVDKKDLYVYNNEYYNSASSIVYSVLESFGIHVSGETAKILLYGIISDSAELRNATAETFVQIGRLLKIVNEDYSEILQEMMHIADPNARAKTIEDIRGSKTEMLGNLLFLYGEAHSHANIAADFAIKLGADLSLFYSRNGSELSFSARLRPPLDRRYGLHLGMVMKNVAPMVGCTGGGHPCAAGAYGPGTDPVAFLKLFRERVVGKVEGKP